MHVGVDFEGLFRTAFPRLVSLGVAKCGRVDVATDLAQETMLRAHDHWAEVSEFDAPEAWCRRVMTNLLIDHHRSTVSEERAVGRLGLPVEHTTSMPSASRWWELVGPLPERQRMVVTLFYADDLSVAEIAEVLGVATGSVKASLFKARRSLKRRMDSEEALADG